MHDYLRDMYHAAIEISRELVNWQDRSLIKNITN